ncbi:MAG: flagellar basal-body MS-ring/collar protein FliF [bacterium]
MAGLRQFVDQIKERWENLSGRNKIVVGLLIATIPAVIISIAVWSSRPDYVVLFSGLTPDNSQAIEDELNIARVPFKKSSDGSSILVPSTEVYKMRLRMANKGLPEAGNSIGFEGFDKTDFGTTDFVQKLKYQRALQVELERTINQIKEISSSRVHIVLPNETVFIDKEQPAKASVVLKLRPGAKLDESQVNGITHLVASAVQGLSKENISIIDTYGNLLATPGQDNFLTDSQLKYQRSVESELASKVKKILDPLLGPNKSTVQVSAQIDFNTTETSSEMYDPEKSAVRSEQSTEYSSKGSGVPMGIPGMTSNVTPNPPVTGGQSDYKGSDSSIEYEVSKTVQRTTQRPGKITKLSVAVVVDNKIVDGVSTPWTQQELNDIKNLVKNAVGFDIARGDPDVEIKNIPFDTTLQQEMASAEKAIKGERLRSMLIKAGIAIVIVALLFILLRFMLRGTKKEALEELEIGTERKLMLDQSAPTETKTDELPEATKEILEIPMTPSQKNKQEIIEVLERDPELVVQVIRDWMAEK